MFSPELDPSPREIVRRVQARDASNAGPRSGGPGSRSDSYAGGLEILRAIAEHAPLTPTNAAWGLLLYLGPRDKDPPPSLVQAAEAELRDLNLSDDANDHDRRLAVDRLTVLGLLPRDESFPGWPTPWPACRQRLEQIVTELIVAPIAKVCHSFRDKLVAQDRAQWGVDDEFQAEIGPDASASHLLQRRIDREIGRCREIIVEALITGRCFCVHKADDLQKRAKATERNCRLKHNLRAWKRSKPLAGWDGALRAPVQGAGFRYGHGFAQGMLAAIVLEQELFAFPALVCKRPIRKCPPAEAANRRQRGREVCGGTIALNNHCSKQTCGELARVESPDIWYWFGGKPPAQHAYRCAKKQGGCGFLYFVHRWEACPNCGAVAWGQEATKAATFDRQPSTGWDWSQFGDIPDPVARSVPAGGPALNASPSVTANARLAASEWIARLQRLVESWPANKEKEAVVAALEGVRFDEETTAKALVSGLKRLYREDRKTKRQVSEAEFVAWARELADAAEPTAPTDEARTEEIEDLDGEENSVENVN